MVVSGSDSLGPTRVRNSEGSSDPQSVDAKACRWYIYSLTPSLYEAVVICSDFKNRRCVQREHLKRAVVKRKSDPEARA
jgi:hypothetical protein